MSAPIRHGPRRAMFDPASKNDGLITVVHLITRLELGGAQENTLHTCEHLDRGRFRVVLGYGPGGHLDERAQKMPKAERQPIAPLVRQVQPRADAAAFGAVVRMLRAQMTAHRAAGLDPRRFVVHTHSSKAGVIGRFAAAVVRVPVVVHGIHSFAFHQGQHPAKFAMYLAAEHAAATVTDAFFCVSEANLREGRERGIISRRHEALVVRSGMDLRVYRTDEKKRARCREALDLPADAEVVLTIANFKPQKDPLTMVSAFRQVARARPRALLLFVGDGELRGAVETALREARLDGRVRLLGWRRDVPDLLAACDVVALSSVFEGLPRSAVQAVAARRPFAGTNVDGTPEIIRHGKNGFLVEPRDPNALAGAIERALEHRPIDPEDEDRIRAWDADRMVTAQQDAYLRLVERG